MATREAIPDDSILRATMAHQARRIVAVLFLAALAAGFLGSGTVCRGAGLLISAPNVTATPGSSGSFDVTITNTTGGTTYNIASDIVELSLAVPSGVNFTGVSITTADTYIYGGNSATNFGSTFSFSTFPGTGFETYDYLYSLGAQPIAPGQTFGLVHVTYSVDPSAMPGAGSLAFGPDTSLYDATGANITDFTAPSGSFTVSSVPEPTSLILLTAGSAALSFHRARKRGVR